MMELTCRVPEDQSVFLVCAIPADVPNVWDVATAIGTVAAAIIALYIGMHSIKASTRVLKQNDEAIARSMDVQKQENERAHRSQAERVSAFIKRNPQHAYSGDEFRLVIQNASDQPIWKVKARHWSLKNTIAIDVFERRIIPPGTDDGIDVGNAINHAIRMEKAGDFHQPVDIWFTDNAGQNWHRPASGPGELLEVRDEAPS